MHDGGLKHNITITVSTIIINDNQKWILFLRKTKRFTENALIYTCLLLLKYKLTLKFLKLFKLKLCGSTQRPMKLDLVNSSKLPDYSVCLCLLTSCVLCNFQMNVASLLILTIKMNIRLMVKAKTDTTMQLSYCSSLT